MRRETLDHKCRSCRMGFSVARHGMTYLSPPHGVDFAVRDAWASQMAVAMEVWSSRGGMSQLTSWGDDNEWAGQSRS